MARLLLAVVLLLPSIAAAVPKHDPTPTWTDPEVAWRETKTFAYVGEYVTPTNATDFHSIQVTAEGERFYLSIHEGQLPGMKWAGNGKVVGHEWCDLDAIEERLAGYERVDRSQHFHNVSPPPEAIVLFDGTDTGELTGARIKDGLLQAGASTKRTFADFTLHFETLVPYKPDLPLSHPWRGNSGVFALGAYEIQIADTFALDPSPDAWGEMEQIKPPRMWCGSIYNFRAPRINASLPPLSWQTFDIQFMAARFEDGKKIRDALINVWQNGLLIHRTVSLKNGTGPGKRQRAEVPSGPIEFQDHNNPVQFRNVWVIDRAGQPETATTTEEPQKTTKPHIVYINADDLGIADVGYNGGPFETPNLDRLRARSMSFTNAYAPAANCAPSRACVHSGQWGPRHGVYTVGNSDRGNARHRRLIPVKNTPKLPTEAVTMAEALKAGGYRTIHLGKYHIGDDPTAEGFDVNIGGDASGSPSRQSGGYYSPWPTEEMQPWTDRVPEGTHRVDVFAEQAVAFLEAAPASPSFVHFSPYLVHTPLTPVPEYVGRYDEASVNAAYGSMVSKLDEAVGTLLDTIDRLGIADRTLIVFSSDNGGIAAVHSQQPYRGGKGSYYDGGIREPLLACWPGRIEPGSTCALVVNTLDLFPTFLDAASLPTPEGVSLDGWSLLPLMERSEAERERWAARPQFWHFPVYLQPYKQRLDDGRDPLFRTRPGSVVRLGDWKLHEYFEDGSLELYNLAIDPGERTNLAATQPEQTQRLHRRLLDWRAETGAAVPTTPNPKFDEAAEAKARAKYAETVDQVKPVD